MDYFQEIRLIKCTIRKILIILFVCCFFTILSIVLTFSKISPFIKDNDGYTFIGIIITLMSIIFTLLVGYQIYNTFELNQRFKDVAIIRDIMKEETEELKKKQKRIDDTINKTIAYNFSTRALLAITDNKISDGIILMLQSILCSLNITDVKEVISDINLSISNILFETTAKDKLSPDNLKTITKLIEEIRQHTNYCFIKSEFEKIKWE